MPPCRFCGRTLDEEIVQCEAVGMQPVRVTFKVTGCTAHSPISERTCMQYLEDAWILRPGSRRRAAGFVKSSDLRQQELHDIITQLHRTKD